MRLTETLASLGRRWYVVVVGLAVTMGMGFLVDVKVPSTFQAEGSILLMPPDSTVGAAGNPYLYLGGLNQALDVLVRRVSAVEVADPILANYPDSTYTVDPDRTTSSPIVIVTAEAPSNETAIKLMDDVLKSVLVTLNTMQDEANVKQILRIHGKDLVLDKEATTKTKTKLQLLIVVVAGGTIGTFLLAGLLDGWMIERRRRKDTILASRPDPTPDPDAARQRVPDTGHQGDRRVRRTKRARIRLPTTTAESPPIVPARWWSEPSETPLGVP